MELKHSKSWIRSGFQPDMFSTLFLIWTLMIKVLTHMRFFLDVHMILQPFFKWYWDVEATRGSYLQFGGGHTFDLDHGINASLGLAFAYNCEQWTNKFGWGDMLLSTNVSYSLILNRETLIKLRKMSFMEVSPVLLHISRYLFLMEGRRSNEDNLKNIKVHTGFYACMHSCLLGR